MDKKQKAEYGKKYRRLNKEKIKQYYEENGDKIRLARRAYYHRNKTDPRHRLDTSISAQIRYAIKYAKDTLWISLDGNRGYTCGQLKAAFERLFLLGMNWENHGTYWQVDHIIPRAKFHYSKADEVFARCWALNNLRPWPAKDNLNKSNTLQK